MECEAMSKQISTITSNHNGQKRHYEDKTHSRNYIYNTHTHGLTQTFCKILNTILYLTVVEKHTSILIKKN